LKYFEKIERKRIAVKEINKIFEIDLRQKRNLERERARRHETRMTAYDQPIEHVVYRGRPENIIYRSIRPVKRVDTYKWRISTWAAA